MKKAYIEPEVEVINFSTEDIMTDSSLTTNDGTYDYDGDGYSDDLFQ
ncbi:MAG: hypothetical protein K6B41_13540 [Butyrivibrio sp.]|nr:hypothetical protein [Butyrivibrio sp.]